MKSNRFFAGMAVALAATVLGASCAHAQLLFTVDINTAALVGNGFGPYSLDIQLNSGSSSNTNSNTVTITDFTATNGTAPDSEAYSTGSTSYTTPPLSITLTDSPSSTFNEVTLSPLTPDTTDVSFVVDLTENAGTVSPDQFLVDLVDTNGGTQSIATDAPNGFSLVQVSDTGDNELSDVQLYTSIEAGTDEADGGSPGAFGTLAAVPEPSTWALLLGGIVLLALRLRRQRA